MPQAPFPGVSLPAATAFGRESYSLEHDKVRLSVTRLGGHLGPAEFRLGRRTISPLSVAPWWNEHVDAPTILKVLRGDFFCMPFGANTEPSGGEQHEIHGETANRIWTPIASATDPEGSQLHLRLRTRIRKGRVDKRLELRKGHSAIYQRHTISGMSGKMPIGHHAMLHCKSEGLLATSPIQFGQINPTRFENPATGGYSCLKPAAEFSSLDHVPAYCGETADLSRYPAREGFEDLVLMASEPDLDFAWTAVTFPSERFLWIAFKDPRVLASTLLWHSNGGRHYPPWNGRHRAVLGLEEVTAYFAEGLHASIRRNPLNARGIPTSLVLSENSATTVNYIMAVAAVPTTFGHVQSVGKKGMASVEISDGNHTVTLAVDLNFLHEHD